MSEAGRVTEDDGYAIAVIRHLIVQAARDGELRLIDQSDDELRGGIIRLMRELAESSWQPAIQSEHQPGVIRAALRFVDEDEADRAIVMYATVFEPWNGMLEVGLKRRGERLNPATERATLENKLTTRWHDLLDVAFPDELRRPILDFGARP